MNFKTSFITKENLPKVYEPIRKLNFDDFLKALQDELPRIEKDILSSGGVLFRGFPICGPEAFNTVVEALGFGKSLSYVGGDTPRDRVSGKIYTSTEAPPAFKIPLHNEMSFIKHYPRHIYFHCATEPDKGGETTIADAREIYNAMNESIREKFVSKGLKYVSNFYCKNLVLDLINRYRRAHKTWMDAFETTDKIEVEKRCKANEFGFKWMKNNWIQVTYETPAFLCHPKTHERTWFNQAHLYDYNPKLLGFWNWIGTKIIYSRPSTIMHEIYFGDGEKIPRKHLYEIMDLLDKKTIKFPWKTGDVLVLDNVLTMHGRAPYQGKRRILASLTR